MMRFKTWLVIHYSKHLLLFGKSVNSFSRCTWKAVCSLMNLKLRAESERSQTLHLNSPSLHFCVYDSDAYIPIFTG